MPRLVLLSLLWLSAFPAAQQISAPKPPTALAATAASRSVVTLSWTASDPAATRYVVERKPLGASWTPPAPPARPVVVTMPAASTTIDDQAIETYATYVYRVRAAGASDVLSAPSNEITVGPPPIGFSQVLVEPSGLHNPGNQFAPVATMTLDANDDPALAYVFMDPNNDDSNADSVLWFMSWNRAKYRWNAPVNVATIGEQDFGHSQGPSLAFDRAANQFGIAYAIAEEEIRVTFTGDGTTWRSVVAERSDKTLAMPSLALGSGRVALAYRHGADGIVFKSGVAAEPADKWTRDIAPKLPGTWAPSALSPSVAIDGAGAPAVAYWSDPESDYSRAVTFWRPGQSSAIKVTDTANHQNDSPDLRLAFAGTQAAIVTAMLRDDNEDHEIWLSRSADGGATWTAPLALPIDGGQSMGAPISVAIDAQARPTIVVHITGGNTGGTRCGVPKMIRPVDATRWTICAPETKGTPTGGETTPSLAIAGNNKAYVAFRTSGEGGGLKSGVVLWRER